ncbi:MAG: hypothetical protein KAQ83_02255, partial [Nanoarchaeota archaeon]|nr:hypothetical protein [Nanoarchaeota archaeon]
IKMNNKKAIAGPVVDFWAIVIYITLIVFFLIAFSILGGCDDSYETGVVQNQGAQTTTQNILLNFLEIPISDISEDITYEPNMADLILLAWTDDSYETKINTVSSNYIGRLYRNYKLKITYPNNQEKEYGFTEVEFRAGGNPMQTYANNIIQFSSPPAVLIDDPDKLKSDTVKVSAIIPTYLNSYINVELEIYKYLETPLYYHIFFRQYLPNYYILAGEHEDQAYSTQSSNQNPSTSTSIESAVSIDPSAQEGDEEMPGAPRVIAVGETNDYSNPYAVSN